MKRIFSTFRGLTRHPTLSIAAILCIALGGGPTTAIATLFYAVLLGTADADSAWAKVMLLVNTRIAKRAAMQRHEEELSSTGWPRAGEIS